MNRRAFLRSSALVLAAASTTSFFDMGAAWQKSHAGLSDLPGIVTPEWYYEHYMKPACDLLAKRMSEDVDRRALRWLNHDAPL